ncbi:carboxypeptidase-like regulatory domain-containing protein [Halorussus limi]|uniref:Carboxypeptidase-like regulatory domain-containing protein n=1 Tax=Halorussus limi TaxID=2938695 RepID=A0A8U0HQM8_9EURY|nr:carboxypeptidase-like regulatory domain-containing protein [Halorussus limi]UPV73179.1 carboxypeptidase-like regulatory domain-containing protein [Halorussus limi]
MALLAVVAGGAFLASAASTYTISGNVTDSSGTAIGNATVIAYDGNGTKLAETTTASDGSYSLSVTGNQTVEVVVSKSGYISESKTWSDLSANQTYSPSLAMDSDGDGIGDGSDAYPSYPRLEYTVSANTSKTVSSVYAEINSTNEVTVTVLHNGTELGNTTLTPSSTPVTVEVPVETTYGNYTLHVHGVDKSNVSSTGVFYSSDSTSGGTSGSSSSDIVGWAESNPAVAALVALVSLGAIAAIREDL